MTEEGTSDAMEILYEMFVKDNPEMLVLIEKARKESNIGHYIYWIRREKKISEKDFAESLGISIRNLRDVEDADFQNGDIEAVYKNAFDKYGELTKHKHHSDSGWFTERAKKDNV